MDAASSGAVSALTLAASIIANVTAVVSIMKMVNYALDWCGQLVNFKGLTLQVNALVSYHVNCSVQILCHSLHRLVNQ